jgi:hypothetical protein
MLRRKSSSIEARNIGLIAFEEALFDQSTYCNEVALQCSCRFTLA